MTERSDRKARGGIQDALSARFPFRGDISRRITASMTLYAVCVILLIGAVSYACVDLLIRKNLRLSMESSARQQAVKLSTSLDSLQEGLSHLSRNSLLINAMIDRVRSSRGDLERRVEERTAELSVANEELLRLNLEKEMAIDRLREALDKISTLRGLLPICAKELYGEYGENLT
ncbi:MAG: hypothetical protein NUW14_03240 [Deltaproteobacteria bacterium]|nr:hypothetical protein [Deltaproteobacteria bacterium]